MLLLDEPTTFLDIHYQLQLLDLLKRLNQQQQLSIITVLHDVNLAARYCDRIALLRQGKLWAVGPPPEVLTPELMREVFCSGSVFIADTRRVAGLPDGSDGGGRVGG